MDTDMVVTQQLPMGFQLAKADQMAKGTVGLGEPDSLCQPQPML